MEPLGVSIDGAQMVASDRIILCPLKTFIGRLGYLFNFMRHIFVLEVRISILLRPVVVLFGQEFEVIRAYQDAMDTSTGILILPCPNYFMIGYFPKVMQLGWCHMSLIL